MSLFDPPSDHPISGWSPTLPALYSAAESSVLPPAQKEFITFQSREQTVIACPNRFTSPASCFLIIDVFLTSISQLLYLIETLHHTIPQQVATITSQVQIVDKLVENVQEISIITSIPMPVHALLPSSKGKQKAAKPAPPPPPPVPASSSFFADRARRQSTLQQATTGAKTKSKPPVLFSGDFMRVNR
jgi:hypothetical protein